MITATATHTGSITATCGRNGAAKEVEGAAVATSPTPAGTAADAGTVFAATCGDCAAIDGGDAVYRIVFITIGTCSNTSSPYATGYVDDAAVDGDFTTFLSLATTDTGSVLIAVGDDELALTRTIALTVDIELGAVVAFHLDAARAGQLGTVAEDEVYTSEDVQRLVIDRAFHQIVVVFAIAATVQALPCVGMTARQGGGKNTLLHHGLALHGFAFTVPRASDEGEGSDVVVIAIGFL